jgi:hypothetical protein
MRAHPPGPIRLSFGPIAREMGLESDQLIADRLGISRRQVQRHKNVGTITVDEAERYAHALGHHPLHFWPNYHQLVGGQDDSSD